MSGMYKISVRLRKKKYRFKEMDRLTSLDIRGLTLDGIGGIFEKNRFHFVSDNSANIELCASRLGISI